jgi:Leucine-rich repeat (LRR) protein
MMRQIALLLSLAVCLAGCGKKQVNQEEKAVSAILNLGGKVTRDEKHPGRPVARIDLRGTKATDSDLKDLKALKGLQTLNLSDTMITDASLKELKALKDLQELDLRNTKITDVGLKDLKQALPKTDIWAP